MAKIIISWNYPLPRHVLPWGKKWVDATCGDGGVDYGVDGCDLWSRLHWMSRTGWTGWNSFWVGCWSPAADTVREDSRGAHHGHSQHNSLELLFYVSLFAAHFDHSSLVISLVATTTIIIAVTILIVLLLSLWTTTTTTTEQSSDASTLTLHFCCHCTNCAFCWTSTQLAGPASIQWELTNKFEWTQFNILWPSGRIQLYIMIAIDVVNSRLAATTGRMMIILRCQ